MSPPDSALSGPLPTLFSPERGRDAVPSPLNRPHHFFWARFTPVRWAQLFPSLMLRTLV